MAASDQTELQVTDDDSLSFPWLHMEGEPEDAYRMFKTYYLPLGPSRTLLKAFMAYLTTERPEDALKYMDNPKMSAAPQWSFWASAWSWRARGHAHDEMTYRGAQLAVAEAREKLLASAGQAADALILSLTNPRLAVAAAKEILDRVGLPAASIIGVANLTPYTADDLEAARREVKEWEAQVKPQVIDSNG